MSDMLSVNSIPVAVLAPTDGGDKWTLLSAVTDPVPYLKVTEIHEDDIEEYASLKIDLANLPTHLKLPESQIHVIISTHSGSRKAEAYHKDLLDPLLSRLNIKYTTHTTTSPTSIGEIARRITALDKEALIILLSGDTGVTEYLNGITGATSKTTVSILALGTANALASAHKLSLASLVHGTPTAFPTLTATFSPGTRENGEPITESLTRTPSVKGCVVASYGFHPSIVGGSETEEYRKLGISRFRMVAEEVLKGTFMAGPGKGFRTYHAKISGIEAAKDSKAHTYVLMALVDRMEPTFVISPKSVDGEVWTVYTGNISGEEMMGVMGGAYAGGMHIEQDIVGYEKADVWKVADLEDREPWRRWICIDGRIFEIPVGGWAELKVNSADNQGFLVLK